MLRAEPVNCVGPDGTTVPFEDPALPFGIDPAPMGTCTPDPSRDSTANAVADAVFGIDSFRDSLTSFVKTLATFWGVLVILAGTWPLSASAAALDAGRPWFSKQTAWIVAFALYKPVAATIYAASFRLIGTPGADADADADPTVAILSGVSVMVVAILALPALIRLVIPDTAPVSGGRGMGSVAGASAALLVAARR
jgi:hypothetical protein